MLSRQLFLGVPSTERWVLIAVGPLWHSMTIMDVELLPNIAYILLTVTNQTVYTLI